MELWRDIESARSLPEEAVILLQLERTHMDAGTSLPQLSLQLYHHHIKSPESSRHKRNGSRHKGGAVSNADRIPGDCCEEPPAITARSGIVWTYGLSEPQRWLEMGKVSRPMSWNRRSGILSQSIHSRSPQEHRLLHRLVYTHCS